MVAFGAIEVWVPVVVFVFAFGLSMDYDECGNNDDAVANDLQRSGRIITSAAVLGDRNW
jgi:RND superfamily putative drug exporter